MDEDAEKGWWVSMPQDSNCPLVFHNFYGIIGYLVCMCVYMCIYVSVMHVGVV